MLAFEERLHRLDSRFGAAISTLHGKLETLLKTPAFGYSARPSQLPMSVVYLFSGDGQYLYAGRTNNFPQRLKNHCDPNSDQNQSSFAFKLARKSLGIERSYSGPNTRRRLMERDDFRAAFEAAKTRLTLMQIQYVEEPDQLRQALLEIYCAAALNTRHNDFGTT